MLGAWGEVLLTDGTQVPDVVADFLAEHPAAVRHAIGGAAAAADPQAVPIVGSNRFATAAAVFAAFGDGVGSAGLASGGTFPDALSGGAHAVRDGGLLLLTGSTELPAEIAALLAEGSVDRVYVYGGTAAVNDDVIDAIEGLIAR